MGDADDSKGSVKPIEDVSNMTYTMDGKSAGIQLQKAFESDSFPIDSENEPSSPTIEGDILEDLGIGLHFYESSAESSPRGPLGRCICSILVSYRRLTKYNLNQRIK